MMLKYKQIKVMGLKDIYPLLFPCYKINHGNLTFLKILFFKTSDFSLVASKRIYAAATKMDLPLLFS